jgi:hypothetical protein
MALKRSTITSSSSSTPNDFTIMTGANGYSRVDLSKTFPSGTYVITSKLLDTTYDIYLIAEDGSNAGYLNASSYIQMTITASKAFNKVVLYGATNDDVLAFEYRPVFSASGQSTSQDAGAAARVISINTSDLPNQNNTTTITGQNFASDVVVTFTGTDNVARSAKSISRTNSTTLIVTRPDDMPTTYAPYTITVNNPGITVPSSTNIHKLTNSITAGNAPSWTTSATLQAYRKNEAYSQTLQSQDADGNSAVAYSIVSGALPDGLSFNTATGVISGTPTANASASYTYTLRTTDSGGNYVDRTFIVQQLAPDAPTIGTATDVGTARAYNDGAATVTFTPAATGPAATSYTATAYLNGSPTLLTGTSSSSPITVAGLASNTGYTFVVKATNFAGGDSLNSSASNSITATTVPQAPTVGTATVTGAQSASIPFTANATGGKTVTNYDITSSPLGLNYTGGASPISAISLPLGTNYTFTVRAYNANGWSASSSASNSVQMAYPASDSDNFNRTTSVALGSTTGNAQAWVADSGTWTANGSQATTSSGFALAHVNINGTNQTVNADAYAQTGVAWWVANGSTHWGAVPYYDTSISYSTSCGTYVYDYSNNDPGGCCANLSFNRYTFELMCCDGAYGYGSGTSACGSSTQRNNICGSNGGYCGCTTLEGPYARCQVNTTTSTTTYNSNIRVIQNGGNYTNSTLTSNTSSYTAINSVRVVTASGNVAISGYSSTGQSGQIGSTISFTPSTTQYQGVGIIKSSQGAVSGSTLDNWSASS